MFSLHLSGVKEHTQDQFPIVTDPAQECPPPLVLLPQLCPRMPVSDLKPLSHRPKVSHLEEEMFPSTAATRPAPVPTPPALPDWLGWLPPSAGAFDQTLVLPILS